MISFVNYLIINYQFSTIWSQFYSDSEAVSLLREKAEEQIEKQERKSEVKDKKKKIEQEENHDDEDITIRRKKINISSTLFVWPAVQCEALHL